jgi:hypothetical protein
MGAKGTMRARIVGAKNRESKNRGSQRNRGARIVRGAKGTMGARIVGAKNRESKNRGSQRNGARIVGLKG